MFTFVQGDTVGRVKERMQERLGVNDKVLLSESSRKPTDLMFYNFKGVGQVQSGFCAAREASLCGGGRQSDQHQGLHWKHEPDHQKTKLITIALLIREYLTAAPSLQEFRGMALQSHGPQQAGRPWIGLEHTNKVRIPWNFCKTVTPLLLTPFFQANKRSRYTYMEKSIKIYN